MRFPCGVSLVALISSCSFVGGRIVAAETTATSTATEATGLVSPDTLLADPAGDPAWRGLFDQLAPNKTRQSKFEERRFFPFRTKPVILEGEIRIVPRLGLSLRYLKPDERVMIIDDKGLMMRDSDG